MMRPKTASLNALACACACLVLQGCSGGDESAQSSAAPAGAAPGMAEQSGGVAAGDAPAAPSMVAGGGAGAAGETVYKTYCVTCHGAEGEGEGPAAVGLNPKPASFAANAFRLDANGNGQAGEIEDIKAVIRDGAAKHGGSPLMAPWPMLSPEQLQSVAERVKAFGEGGA